jgi:preprotein translocase YajC subunit
VNDAELMSALIVGVVVGFYFMFMRPDLKAKERHKKEMLDLRPGDQVLTTSNFVAKVRDIQVLESGQTHIALELTDGMVVTALPAAILEVLARRAGEQVEPADQKGVSA